jgi:hypothetical protein
MRFADRMSVSSETTLSCDVVETGDAGREWIRRDFEVRLMAGKP